MKIKEEGAVLVPIKKIRTVRKKRAIKAKNIDILPVAPKKRGRPRKKVEVDITPSTSETSGLPPLNIRGGSEEVIEMVEVMEEPSLISEEEKADFATPISSLSFSPLTHIREQYATSALPDIEEAAASHNNTVKELTNELERIIEKHTKFKRLAENVFNQNNYVENDDSWNLRQYAKHYGERMDHLERVLQEQHAIKLFFEQKIRSLLTLPTVSEEHTVIVFKEEIKKRSWKEKVKYFFKLLLKFYRPRN